MKGDTHMLSRKRALAIAGSLALVSSLAVGAFETSAGAVLAKHNAANDSVTCNDVVGTIKFATALHLGGTTPNTITLSIKSGDCTDTTAGVYNKTTNPNGVSLKSVVFSGKLHSSTNDCLGLQGLSTGTTGSVPGTWATNAGTPALVNTHSTLSVTQTWGGTFGDGGVTSPASDSDSWGGQYGFFAIGASGSGNALGSGQSNTTAPTITGSFTGGDSGHKTTFDGSTSQSEGDLGTECFSTTGITSITFGIGGTTLK
jgi:hypothetical protein